MDQIAGQNTCNCFCHFEELRDPSHHWAYPVARLQAMFADAGLNVEHVETFTKEMEFDPWADRMGASVELKAQLRQWLNDAPAEVKAFLAPRTDGDKMFFALHEALLIGRKKGDTA